MRIVNRLQPTSWLQDGQDSSSFTLSELETDKQVLRVVSGKQNRGEILGVEGNGWGGEMARLHAGWVRLPSVHAGGHEQDGQQAARGRAA